MKVWNYVIITTGLILILQLAGIETGAQGLMNSIGLGTDSANISVGSFYDYIFNATTGILMLGAIAGVVVGFFTRSSPENFIILPIIGAHLALFVSSLVSIMNYFLGNYEPFWGVIIVLLLGPLTVGYLLALVEFFRGTD